MTRVLVVHHDLDMADEEVASMRRAGYEVDQCAGPTHALHACPVMRGLPCWQVDWADVVVYDEWAAGNGGGELTEDLRILYPDKPVVLTSLGASLSSGRRRRHTGRHGRRRRADTREPGHRD